MRISDLSFSLICLAIVSACGAASGVEDKSPASADEICVKAHVAAKVPASETLEIYDFKPASREDWVSISTQATLAISKELEPDLDINSERAREVITLLELSRWETMMDAPPAKPYTARLSVKGASGDKIMRLAACQVYHTGTCSCVLGPVI